MNYQGKTYIQSIAVQLRGKYSLIFIILKKMNLEVQNLNQETLLDHVKELVQDNRHK